MHNSKVMWIKAVVFLIIFVLINSVLNFILCPKYNYSRNTLREMYNQEQNIDVVFAGSSYSIKDVNPYIMDERLGCNTFSYGFSAQIYQGTYYCLKELFEYHKPKLVVLNTDLFSYTRKEEDVMAYIPVEANIRSTKNKIDYYFASVRNGSYLDRLFFWRGYHVKSPKEALDNIKDKINPNYANYPTEEQLEKYKDSKGGYIGKGFVLVDEKNKKNVLNDNTLGVRHRETTELSEIQPSNVEYFKKIVELCKSNNSELVLMQMPLPTYRIFEEVNYFKFSEKISEIAEQEGIEFYDYNLIKPELFKSETSYFQDYAHLNGKGAEVFSKSLAEFLNLRSVGQDMSQYFYSPEEYCKSINYINNTWFTTKSDDEKITFIADSYYGSNVIPEYQFILTDTKTGKSKVIRDYSTDTTLTIEEPKSNYKIRLNAREKGSDVEYSRYYEKEVKK